MLKYTLIILIVLASCQHDKSFSDRTTLTFDWKEVYSLPNDEIDIPRFNRMEFNENGLFIHDFSHSQILRIDIEKNKITSTYGGSGSGPGEMGQIYDFNIENDRLITVDVKLLRFTEFDIQSGKVLQTFTAKGGMPLDIVPIDSLYLVLSGVSDSLVILYDPKQNIPVSTASILDLDIYREYSMSMTGSLLKTSSNTVLYLPIYDHRLFEFIVENGIVRRGRIFESPIDTFTFKTSFDYSQGENAMIKAPDTNYLLKLGATPLGSRYLFTYLYAYCASSPKTTERLIDVMNSNFEYEFSFGNFHPKSITRLAAHGDILCILFGDNTLSCYEIPEELR